MTKHRNEPRYCNLCSCTTQHATVAALSPAVKVCLRCGVQKYPSKQRPT